MDTEKIIKMNEDGLLHFLITRYNIIGNVQITGYNKNCYNINLGKTNPQFVHDLFTYSGLQRKTDMYKTVFA